MARLRVATRGSALARWQAQRVIELLAADAELVVVTTAGDRRADTEIHAMGGTGVFVKEVQQAVLDGHADVAVHSAKDLPSATPEGLTLAAFPERADARDALVGCPLAELATGAAVATGAVRRRAQLAALRPDLRFVPLRGNVETRLAKSTAVDAAVVALAALERLELTAHVAEVLDPRIVLPQVGQGALAVECRSQDTATAAALAAIDDPAVRAAVVAERAFLAQLGGGCDLPVGALGVYDGGSVALEVLLATLDGRIVLRAEERGDDPERVGAAAARALLDGAGGRALVEVGG
jgi:hydroxymethylbilane synthase